MPVPNELKLLTTKPRAVAAVGCTALVLALAVLGRLKHAPDTGMAFYYFLHGWARVAANIILWLYLLWLCFVFSWRTRKVERIFVLGFFLDILLFPARWLSASWNELARNIGIVGLLISLFAALSILKQFTDQAIPSANDGSVGTNL